MSDALGDFMFSGTDLWRANRFLKPSRDSLFADRGGFSARLSSMLALITKSGGLILRDNLLGVGVSVGVEIECLGVGSTDSVIADIKGDTKLISPSFLLLPLTIELRLGSFCLTVSSSFFSCELKNDANSETRQIRTISHWTMSSPGRVSR